MEPRSFWYSCAATLWLGCGAPTPLAKGAPPPPLPPSAAQTTSTPVVQAGSTPQSAAQPTLPSMPVVHTEAVPLADLTGTAGAPTTPLETTVGSAGSGAPDAGLPSP